VSPAAAADTSGNGALFHAAAWGALNQTVVSAHGDGAIRLWDVETGVETRVARDHAGAVHGMQLSGDRTMVLSASADRTARLFDARTLKPIRTYRADRPLRAAALSPSMAYVIAGGGQDADSVTTTGARSGRFETLVFECVLQEQRAALNGHFGPINALAFQPDGAAFASGSEDGYVRLTPFHAAGALARPATL
jgi:translation initiation factor 3 subunit I